MGYHGWQIGERSRLTSARPCPMAHPYVKERVK